MSRLSKRIDPEAALGEHRAELLVPGEHLGAEAHDQQQRLPVGVADLLVGELDPVGWARGAPRSERSSTHGSPPRCPGRRLSSLDAHGDRLRPAPRQRLRRGRRPRRDGPAAAARGDRGRPTASSCSATSLELREKPLAATLEAARPFFEELGAAMAGRHDRRSSPATTTTASPSRCSKSWRSPAGRSGSSTTRPPQADAATTIAGWLGEAGARPRLPGGLAARRRLRDPRPLHGLPHEPAAARVHRRGGRDARLRPGAGPGDARSTTSGSCGRSTGSPTRSPSPSWRSGRRRPSERAWRTISGRSRARRPGPARPARRRDRGRRSRRRSGASTASCAPTSTPTLIGGGDRRQRRRCRDRARRAPRRRRRPPDHRPHPPRRARRERRRVGAARRRLASTTPAAGSSPPPSTTPGRRPAPTGPEPSPGSRTMGPRGGSASSTTAPARTWPRSSRASAPAGNP